MARSTTTAKAGAPAKKAAARAGKPPKKDAAGKAAGKPTREQRAEARRREQIRKLKARSGHRYLVHYDIEGPRVRLGLLWFVGSVAAIVLGPVATGLWFGVAFAAAGSHTLRTWRARGAPADPRVALLAVALTVVAAAVHPRAMGVAVLALAAAAVGLAARQLGEGDGMGQAVARAGVVLQCALPVAVAGGCFVLLADLEIWAALSLLLLVSAYETGDFLIGSGSVNAFEGPLAGGVAVLVVTLVVAALGFPPFGVGEAFAFGLLVAPGAFAGQMLASAMLPHARAFAPALRRIDSLLLVAPLWYLGIDALVV
ncbi:MAG: hypothetical protein ACLGIZ_08770 [Acidimicrobiia bacterium]